MASSERTSRSVSAVVGSSMTMRRAFEASARQIATSCLSATDSVSTRRSRSIATPTRSNAAAAIFRICERRTSRRPSESSAEKATFSATERFGNSEKSWKITWMPAAIASRGDCTRSVAPSIVTPPRSGRTTPDSTLIRVDLPLPFSPARQTTSPGESVKPTSESAVTPA